MYYQSFYPYQPFQSLDPLGDSSSRTTTSSMRFFNVEEGYAAGNIIKNEYTPYKNYQIPPLKPTSDKEAKLMALMAIYGFRHDLNLILDVYPTDKEALDLFVETDSQYKKAYDDYVKQYGPLSAQDATDNKGTFSYVTVPSPWIGK